MLFGWSQTGLTLWQSLIPNAAWHLATQLFPDNGCQQALKVPLMLWTPRDNQYRGAERKLLKLPQSNRKTKLLRHLFLAQGYTKAFAQRKMFPLGTGTPQQSFLPTWPNLQFPTSLLLFHWHQDPIPVLNPPTKGPSPHFFLQCFKMLCWRMNLKQHYCYSFDLSRLTTNEPRELTSFFLNFS